MDSYRRNELPETVKRYKTYTDQFQEWLMRTAVQRNVERASQILERAKQPKGRKSSKISIEQQALLVDGIAKTKAPLEDTSGLQDLADAIRSRKEIAEYYKATKTSDVGHTYFSGVLENFKAALKCLLPGMYEAQGVEDEVSNFVIIDFSQHSYAEDNDELDAVESGEPENLQTSGNDRNDVDQILKNESKGDLLTPEELELQQELQVLVFLYEFNRIRGIVSEIWLLYHNGSISAITAALVADLAQSHVQQNVAALVEELAIPHGYLPKIVLKLYEKMLLDSSCELRERQTSQLTKPVIRHLLCIDAINSFYAYLSAVYTDAKAPQKASQPVQPSLAFLEFFDLIREKKMKLPIWDKFTEDMLSQGRASKDWLVFGFQMIRDLEETSCKDHIKLLYNITEHSLDILKLMRDHVDYEDRMWAAGNKPDYLCREDFKFSDVFLHPLDSLLGWIQDLMGIDGVPDAFGKFTPEVFIVVHSTFAGLTMWHFNKVYQSTAIAKVQWFITCLCHLYNAARQVGGLNIAWPDLDFIIQMHGTQRIFIGDPPTDPRDFIERFRLACCASSRSRASDYRQKGKHVPYATREARHKRGLVTHFPLEDTIKTYYGPNPKDDRWLKRHAIFNYLHQRRDTSADASEDGSQETDTRLKALRDAFTCMSARISLPKSKNKRECSFPLPTPDFSQMDDTYPNLLRGMKTELQSHESHKSFDYLSFYRRAFDLVTKIRNEVLLDSNMHIAIRGSISINPNPRTIDLVTWLFRALKIKHKDKKVETTRQEVFPDVTPLGQLGQIAKMMESLIQEKGSVELGRAKLRTSCDWDGLKASYASEEAVKPESAQESKDLSQDDDEDSNAVLTTQLEANLEAVNGFSVSSQEPTEKQISAVELTEDSEAVTSRTTKLKEVLERLRRRRFRHQRKRKRSGSQRKRKRSGSQTMRKRSEALTWLLEPGLD
ncbi:Nn.00g097570.m01.CDS01 [Neocucurbitaria sp. VM-36]